MEIKKEKFLNLEEADNLQDMINFAASININQAQTSKNAENNNIYPVESLYSQILNNTTSATSDKLEIAITEILKR